MTCTVWIVNQAGWLVVELWTASKPECSDWLALFKWAHAAGGWSEWR